MFGCGCLPGGLFTHGRQAIDDERVFFGGELRASMLARKAEFVEANQSDLPSPVLLEKIFRFAADPNHFHIPRHPVPQRGVSRPSRTRDGMRWTRVVLLTRALPADGEVVWS